MGHPDFRAGGRIFASLDADGRTGTVKLTPDQQARFTSEHAEVFAPASGAWGRQGYTRVALSKADEETVGEAMTLAWQSVQGLRQVIGRPRGRKPTPTRKSR
jgi:hypothetical protein